MRSRVRYFIVRMRLEAGRSKVVEVIFFFLSGFWLVFVLIRCIVFVLYEDSVVGRCWCCLFFMCWFFE